MMLTLSAVFFSVVWLAVVVWAARRLSAPGWRRNRKGTRLRRWLAVNRVLF